MNRDVRFDSAHIQKIADRRKADFSWFEEEMLWAIGSARDKGATWEEIAEAWGVTRQAATIWYERRIAHK